MLDAQGRLVIPAEQLKKANQKFIGKKLKIYFDFKNRILRLQIYEIPHEQEGYENIYYIASHTLDNKGRITIPKIIREAFGTAAYLPVEKNGEILILII